MAGGTMRRWDGSQFKTGGSLKRWNGSAFKTGGTLRRWTGYEFVPDPSPGTISLSNTAEGGTDGTAITNASQTGGGSGNAFNSLDGTSGISFSSTQAIQGSLSYKMTQAASNPCGFNWNVSSPTELYMRAYFYFTAYATSSHVLFDTYNGNTAARITLTGTGSTPGQLRLVNNNTTIATTTGALSLNTWYRIEFHAKFDASAGVIEVRAYSGQTHTMVTTVSQTGVATTTTYPTSVRVGSNASISTPTTPTVYIDNIAYGTGGWLGA